MSTTLEHPPMQAEPLLEVEQPVCTAPTPPAARDECAWGDRVTLAIWIGCVLLIGTIQVLDLITGLFSRVSGR